MTSDICPECGGNIIDGGPVEITAEWAEQEAECENNHTIHLAFRLHTKTAVDDDGEEIVTFTAEPYPSESCTVHRP